MNGTPGFMTALTQMALDCGLF